MNTTQTYQLQLIAWELRLKALEMVYRAQSGHIGGSFSIAEILTALYFYKARLNPQNPHWKERDRIFISKGHCAPIYYAALAKRGFFDEEELKTLRQLGSRLQGHPVIGKLPGVEISSGPLGLGASAAVGSALGLKLRKIDSVVYCILGDGESQEGIVWEAAMTAYKYKLDNLVFILDYNGVQLSGSIKEIMPLDPIRNKWEAFGWQVIEIDGNVMKDVIYTMDHLPNLNTQKPSYPEKLPIKTPTIIIAHTVKGKGVSFMENKSKWHGKVPNEEEYNKAIHEIMEQITSLKSQIDIERSSI